MSFDNIVNNPADTFLIPVENDINPNLVGMTSDQVASIMQPVDNQVIEPVHQPCLPCQQKAMEGHAFSAEVPGAIPTPEELQAIDLALIIDNHVVEFVRTHARTAAAMLSNPVVVDVTGKVAARGGFLTEGMIYNPDTRTFYSPIYTLEN